MGVGSNIFASGNHDSILGNFGKKFQKYTARDVQKDRHRPTHMTYCSQKRMYHCM